MKVSPNEFIHPEDKIALENMEAIPGFSSLVKKFLEVGLETLYYGTNMASNIRLSATQLPRIYNHLPPICEKLGIPEPELYLEMDPYPNAYTFGDTKIFLTVTSGLIDCMTDEELDAVLAHECGHIACHHVLYHSMATILKASADMFGLLGSLSMPLRLAILYWERMSELSADRCAAIVKNPELVASTMARLAGGPKSITQEINFAEWAQQADLYKAIKESNNWNKALQAMAIMNQNHPFLAVRVKEIMDWSATEDFKRVKKIIDFQPSYCPECKIAIQDTWEFCPNCGARLKKGE